MPDWLIIVLFSGIRAIYSAAVEAFLTWGLVNLLLPDHLHVSFWICYIFWYVIGFIVSVLRVKRIFKNL
jgi:hypothetical protein